MSAWMIVHARIHDREALMQGYGPASARLAEQFGGRYIIRAPGAVQLEGPGQDGGSVVVSEWPDRETALRFWNSPEYAEVKKLREGIADISVTLVGS